MREVAWLLHWTLVLSAARMDTAFNVFLPESEQTSHFRGAATLFSVDGIWTQSAHLRYLGILSLRKLTRATAIIMIGYDTRMIPRFVIISGSPASGKTTVARGLSRELGLALIDKDEILEQLFMTRGSGDNDWRRSLSRAADDTFSALVLRSSGAVACSFWHQVGMRADSGTPTEWLSQLPRPIVHVRCVCPAGVAARRFASRTRHPGHLDIEKDVTRIEAEFRALADLPPVELLPRVDVDTNREVDIAALMRAITTTAVSPDSSHAVTIWPSH
jgi:AAA domain-containing protein